MSAAASVENVTLVPVVLPAGEAASPTVESACLALQTISEYATLTGTARTAPVRDLVVDLVADLMHLCAQSGISFEAVVEEASTLVVSDCDAEFTG